MSDAIIGLGIIICLLTGLAFWLGCLWLGVKYSIERMLGK